MSDNIQSPNDFWRGKKVLITGADGLVATHLATRLIQLGALVYGTIRNRIRVISRLDLFNLRPHLTLFRCDLRDFRGMLDIIAGENIDTVFHLAASALVNIAARNPLATIESNILGSANVLEVCRQVGVERIVVASSDKAYGDHRSNLPYTEAHRLQGLHVYDCSKSCTDLIAQTYYFQYHLPVRVTRCCNIYGPGDLNFSRLIPGTIVRTIENIPPVIRKGQGNVKREYIFVLDVVDAYLTIAHSIHETTEENIPDTGERAYSFCAYNIGGGEANVKTTREMIFLIQNLMKTDLKPRELPRLWHPYVELPDQYLDTTKILHKLGYSPSTDLKVGLEKTIEWYKSHQNKLRRLYETEILPV